MFLRYILASIILMVTILTVNDSGVVDCKLSANHIEPQNFCFETEILIENTTVSDINNKPVRVSVNTATGIATDVFDSRNWDFTPSISALNNNPHFMAQNLNNVNSPYWVWMDSIPAGSVKKVRVLSGSDSQRNDNGLLLNGYNEPYNVVNSASLNFSGETSGTFEIIFDTFDLTARNEDLLEKGTSYKISLVDAASVLNLRFSLNGVNCDVALTEMGRNSWRGEYLAAAGVDFTIFKNDVSVATCDTDVVSIASDTSNLIIGDDLTSTQINYIKLVDGSGIAAEYSFDANDLTELTSIGDTFTGTFLDSTANNNDGTYSFTELQTGITTSVSQSQLANLSNFPVPESGNERFNEIIDSELINANPTVVTGFIGDGLTNLDSFSSTANINPDGVKVAITMGIGLVLAFIIFGITRFPAAAVVALATPVSIGAMAQWYNPLWALLLIIALPIMWFGTTRMLNPSQ